MINAYVQSSEYQVDGIQQAAQKKKVENWANDLGRTVGVRIVAVSIGIKVTWLSRFGQYYHIFITYLSPRARSRHPTRSLEFPVSSSIFHRLYSKKNLPICIFGENYGNQQPITYHPEHRARETRYQR